MEYQYTNLHPFELSRLIARHLAGEMTSKERQHLDAWLDASERHRALFARVQDERFARERLEACEQADVERAIARFLASKHGIEERRKRRRAWRVTHVAGIAVLAVVGWWALERTGQPFPAEEKPSLLPSPATSITLTTTRGESVKLPSTLLPEQRVGTDLVLKQDSSGLVRLLPTGNDEGGDRYRTVSVPRGGEFRIVLDDGTRVWVNAETQFSFPLEFTGRERRVMLEGEAYFEVAKDEARVFIVETPLVEVRARGTEFNLSTGERRGRTVATLEEGEIDFRVLATREEIAMRAGEQVVLTDEGWKKREVVASFYASWREGRLSFFSELLEDMLEVIARWYNVEVIFVN